MAEEVHVWVKTELINPGNTAYARSLPGSSDNDDSFVDWGWAYAVIVDRSETTLQVAIRDEDNPNHGKSYQLNPDCFERGLIVSANKHCGENGFLDSDSEVDIKYYPDDLITLTHLHEPAVVHCLQQRYAFDKIYTATGSILLALNPFKQCKELYNQSVMETYWKRGEARMGIAAALEDDEKHRLPPHVYSIADDCFRVMMKRLNGDDPLSSSSSHRGAGIRARSGGSSAKATTCDQTILVSGESGSGKTVTTKFIMQYLAALSQRVQKMASATRNGTKSKSTTHGSDAAPPEEGHKNVEQQVLQSNPILESFGNARTIRNDNSSRFGKFIEIKFSKTGTLIGASIETYLLEKVRLLTQAEGERNYHIFYELFCMSDEELEAFDLHEYTLEDFTMINKSGTFDRRDGVEDSETYQELRQAMSTMGFQEEEQQDALSIAAACLHGANLSFIGRNADESALDFENQHLEPFVKLLGLTPEALDKALCYLKIKAGKEYHTRTLPKAKAEKGLEALIKATYGALFTHLVRRINESITVKDPSSGKGRRPLVPTTGQATIGVLDIFGFESFKVNSFEQLCINYCNEALQHQFNLFVLEKEQEEYEREGIEWSFISFPGNQDVLDLIDKTGSGILRILDDQCRAPGTTDKTFCGDLYKKCTGHTRFEANHRQVGALKFAVRHYAGLVEYDTDGFVEKNRDDLPREAADLLLSSTRPAIQNLAIIINDLVVGLGGPTTSAPPAKLTHSRSLSPKRPSGGGTRVTVGGQFAQQLQELRNKIDITAPHYVRCLKPNDILVPDHFDPLIISDQLRYAGVIEAVRVSRAGFPQRYSHSAFVSRYRVLGFAELKKAARSTRKSKPVEVLAQAVASLVSEEQERRGDVNGNNGDSGKNEASKSSNDVAATLRKAGIQVGKTKVFLRRSAFDTLELLRTGRMAESAVQIQAIARRYIVRRDYRSIRNSAIIIQSVQRMIRDTRRVKLIRRNHGAKRIQTSWRKSTLQRRYRCVVKVCRWCQKMQRGRIGRRRFGALNRQKKAAVIQKCWRRFPIARRFRMLRNRAVTIQCAFRCWAARTQHRELRLQARDLGAAVQERDALKQRVRELQEQVATQQKSVADEATNNERNSELASLKAEVEIVNTENKHLRAEIAQLHEKVKFQDEQAIDARKNLDELRCTVEAQRQANEALTMTLRDREQELGTSAEGALALRSSIDSLTTKNQQLHSEMQSMQLNRKTEATAAVEAAERLTKKLQLALDSRLQENQALTASLLIAENELKEVRESQIVTLKDYSDNGMSTLDADKTNEWSLAEENDRLRQEIFDLKEKSKSLESALSDKLKVAGNTIEDLRKNASPKKQDNAPRASTDQLDEMKHELSAAKRKYQSELKEAKDQIKHLERRLLEAEEDVSFQAERPSFTVIPSEASTQEILTLQDEVSRLNKELAAAKTWIESRTGQLDDANSPEMLALRFAELRRLSEACLEKDQEISRLKSQLENSGSDDMSHISFSVHSGGSPEGVDLLRQDIRELKAQLTSRSIPEEGPESDDNRSKSLEKKNKELRSEMESSKKKISQLETSLKEERERSMEDLNAFSRTLQEVDELRLSAQTMSRQLALAKAESKLALAKAESKRIRQQPASGRISSRYGGLNRHRALVDIPPLWGAKLEKKLDNRKQADDGKQPDDDDEDVDEEDEEDDFDDGVKSVVTSLSNERSGGKHKRRGSGSSMFSAFF